MSNRDINIHIKRKKLRHRKKIINLITFSLISILSITIGFKKILSFKIRLANITSKNRFIPTSSKNVPLDSADVFTICIDAGHGDWDFGTIGLNDSAEKDIVLSITIKLGELLESQGIDVVYTRTTDTLFWSDNSTENLYERVNISKDSGADLFISIHCNSSDESHSYKGIETWYNNDDDESNLFATLIQNELSNLEYTSDRGTKYYSEDEPLAVLNNNDVPSVLIELGFLSNLSDESFLTSENGQSLSAEAIFNGILTYKDTLN
ncbi:N-acetylmuramoyl-L-alanine amidase family protein [Clostridium gasigenes]|uniref:N-acetylmuramoyl-L-alanine amidase family protein n=1 Tax=Clostridium gasigenes TaxID=94869 RepID=UPI001C0CE8E3|nr:N-acetylmuramoyl-L-alanine amidase [Clostridium gasigenes]MBU3105875.1 N-acetylmuramoyl-L-alanine amidase [Clostridium gasigenes]